jgi:DNA-binding beta-propeller fold protein YncE
MKGNSGRKLMAMILFLVLPAVLLAPLSVRSATADTVVSTVAVGSGPLAVAVNPVTNKIYTVNNDNIRYTVTVIDGATNSTSTVSVGQGPSAVAVNPATDKIYIVNCGQGPGDTTPNWDGTVTVIDGVTNKTATLAVGLNPVALAVNQSTNKIYVAGGNRMAVIDGATTSVAQKPINFTVGQNSYTATGQSFAMNASPFILNGRTLVPVRYLADALGAQTGWDANTQKVTITGGNTIVVLTIGSANLTTNGQESQMDVAPVIVNGRTCLPARYVAEAFYGAPHVKNTNLKI